MGSKVVPVAIPLEKVEEIERKIAYLHAFVVDFKANPGKLPKKAVEFLHNLEIQVGSLSNLVYTSSHEGGHEENKTTWENFGWEVRYTITGSAIYCGTEVHNLIAQYPIPGYGTHIVSSKVKDGTTTIVVSRSQSSD